MAQTKAQRKAPRPRRQRPPVSAMPPSRRAVAPDDGSPYGEGPREGREVRAQHGREGRSVTTRADAEVTAPERGRHAKSAAVAPGARPAAPAAARAAASASAARRSRARPLGRRTRGVWPYLSTLRGLDNRGGPGMLVRPLAVVGALVVLGARPATALGPTPLARPRPRSQASTTASHSPIRRRVRRGRVPAAELQPEQLAELQHDVRRVPQLPLRPPDPPRLDGRFVAPLRNATGKRFVRAAPTG